MKWKSPRRCLNSSPRTPLNPLARSVLLSSTLRLSATKLSVAAKPARGSAFSLRKQRPLSQRIRRSCELRCVIVKRGFCLFIELGCLREFRLYLLDFGLELDVLGWWKKEELRYSILSRLAGDMLMIPVSTVASESAFSTVGRILDQYRSSLLPETVQALLCSRDYLFSKKVQDSSVVDSLVEDVLDLNVERGNEYSSLMSVVKEALHVSKVPHQQLYVGRLSRIGYVSFVSLVWRRKRLVVYECYKCGNICYMSRPERYEILNNPKEINRLQQYKMVEMKLLAQQRELQTKIPDIEKCLAVVATLQEKKGSDEPILADFEVSEGIYSRARIEDTDSVCLWLGANVMLEYTCEEAITLLKNNLENANGSLEVLIADLQFLRDQITITQVTIARVYNWDVHQRRLQQASGLKE
ncbi:hypothetical protein QQ045_011467 [Rhodiola kirilowii]